MGMDCSMVALLCVCGAAAALPHSTANLTRRSTALGDHSKRPIEVVRVLYALGGLYCFLFIVACTQLVRVRIRRPDLGGTSTQKVFLLLNAFFLLIRTIFFLLTPDLAGRFFNVDFQDPVFAVLADLPANLFITTYTLLALFWLEVLAYTKQEPRIKRHKYRAVYAVSNLAMYLIQIIIWLCIAFLSQDQKLLDMVDNFFHAVSSLVAGVAIVVSGGQLYLRLRRFPIDGPGRKEKMREIGMTTVVLTLCFAFRAALTCLVALVRSIDSIYWFLFVFFVVTEVIPCVLVLYILRRLPPKRPLRHTPSSSSSDNSQHTHHISSHSQQNLYAISPPPLSPSSSPPPSAPTAIIPSSSNTSISILPSASTSTSTSERAPLLRTRPLSDGATRSLPSSTATPAPARLFISASLSLPKSSLLDSVIRPTPQTHSASLHIQNANAYGSLR